MNHYRNLLCKQPLELSQVRSLCMSGNCRLDLFPGEHCEDLYVSCRIFVGDVEPELVELVRGCPFRVEPYIPLFRLAELASVRFCDERAGKCICLLPEHPAYELGAGGNVAPLVAPSHLKGASLVLVQPQEVVSLEKLVCEFRE